MRPRNLLILTFLFITSPLFGWSELQPGFQYKKQERIHLFRVDPQKFRVDLVLASDYESAALPAKKMREKSGASLVINGGFFDDAFRSLGLMVRGEQLIQPVRKAPWGIFQIKGGQPSIIHYKDWIADGVTLALQVGPRLVVDGKLPKFKPETAPHRRSALGVTSEGKILIAISEAPLGIKKWAEVLKEESPNALNLDGGGSSQISVKMNDFSLEVLGTTNIPNGLAIH